LQNLKTLVSAVPEISIGALKFKIGHVTLTTPILRVIYRFVIHMLVLNVAYLCATFDDYSCSRSRDMVG